MSPGKSHNLLQKHTYARPLMCMRAISRCGVAHSQSTRLCAACSAPTHSCSVMHCRHSAGDRSASQASPSPPLRYVACSATCRFHLIHTSLGIHVFSFTLSLSLPFSHAHTLMASSRSITHSLSDYLGFSCSQSSLKHATSRQRSHIHCARCHQASLHSRHDNASKLDSYAPNPTLVPGVSLEGRNEAGGPL